MTGRPCDGWLLEGSRRIKGPAASLTVRVLRARMCSEEAHILDEKGAGSF